MTKKLYSNTLSIILLIFITNISYATVTEDGFSNIRAEENKSFRADFNASKDRIIEEMCDSQIGKTPTTESILDFITTIQIYINKIKDTQNITPETVSIARLAVIDVAKARKMLYHTTPADIQVNIRHAIQSVDMEVIALEKHLSDQLKTA